MITRPELSYCQSQLAKFMGSWGEKHYKAAILELKYLIKTKLKVLSIRPMKGYPEIEMWVDSDHFGDVDPNSDYKGASHGGFAAMLRGNKDMQLTGNLVSSRSKKHKVITLSSTEAEIREAVNGGKEAEWLRYLLYELGYPQLKPTIIREDNNGCISFSKNATHHDATKHVVLRYYWLKEQVAKGHITLQKIHTHDNIADIFTKLLPRKLFDKHAVKLLRSDDDVNVNVNMTISNDTHACRYYELSRKSRIWQQRWHSTSSCEGS